MAVPPRYTVKSLKHQRRGEPLHAVVCDSTGAMIDRFHDPIEADDLAKYLNRTNPSMASREYAEALGDRELLHLIRHWHQASAARTEAERRGLL